MGQEAGELIVEHGFKSLNLHRIYCGTARENMGMRKLAEKLGFKEEGVNRESSYKNGKFCDSINYGLLRYEYKA